MEKSKAHTELFRRYLNDQCTAEEIEQLLGYFNTLNEKELRGLISQAMQDDRYSSLSGAALKKHVTDIYTNISAKLIPAEEDQVILVPFYKRKAFIYLSAACIAMVVTGLAAMFYNKHPSMKFLNTPGEVVADDVGPGGNDAVLTLANGTKISLSDVATGEIAEQAGIEIVKTKDGQLIYTVRNMLDDKDKASANNYNTISTPKGGQHEINLPDGTKVWLNAASSLKFLPNFTVLKERRVELNGEAYFEVNKDKTKPFRVVTVRNGATQTIEVLGTHFNVNNYTDESSTKTTLVEGSVRILTDASQPKILKPGQQATLTDDIIAIKTVETEDVIAWKNGNFIFNDESLESIMRQVARWYDVEVYYQDKLPEMSSLGVLSRSKNLSTLLKILEASGEVHFKIEGRRVTVMK